ncbi:DUF92 domain-containing protein [Effusibacillus dendaii]|uniref:DUF92 domain-containing protein n=1 Tax=Effusibacillus dendaii TaxID=2743772 RepID=A0A7I8D6J6_9BACL|nr:DUF92 domain-containing protein [Effusibacillus dendaii]BCJ85768.1 hypothetical protein skT53_07530 [Effusibacillus dendaii]
MIDFVIGCIGSIAISGIAYGKRSLSFSGAIAAVFVGTILYGVGSVAWFGTLIAFFVSSSLLSKYKQNVKRQAEQKYEKTGRRDAGQVWANGGTAVFLALANAFWPTPLWWIVFVGVMAAVNADTWATEIGGLSPKPPRSILTGRRVEAGTSGAVSGLGVIASAAGGLFIGGIAGLLNEFLPEPQAYVLPTDPALRVMFLTMLGIAAGLTGSLTDSLIGARWQSMYRCSVCGMDVERKFHCDSPAQPIQGYHWMTNDSVNLISSWAGGGIGLIFYAGYVLNGL